MFYNNNGGFFDLIIRLIILVGRQRQSNRRKEVLANIQKNQSFRSSEQLDNPLFTQIAEQVPAPDFNQTLINKDHTTHVKVLIDLNHTNKSLLSEMTAATMNTKPIEEHENTAIRQLSFQETGSHEEKSLLRVITVNEKQKSLFPYLKTELEISFHTETIIEWDIDEPVEAEIEGTWNDVFTLSFFASDYSVNRHIYKSKQDIKLRLSAFILDINATSIDAKDVNYVESDYGYWPDERNGKFSHFEFEALVLTVTARVNKYYTGCILTLKILKDKHGNDLIIDAYVSSDNVAAQTISKGMRITGNLWLQGELAEST